MDDICCNVVIVGEWGEENRRPSWAGFLPWLLQRFPCWGFLLTIRGKTNSLLTLVGLSARVLKHNKCRSLQ